MRALIAKIERGMLVNNLLKISLRRHRNPARHIWMKATEVGDVACMLQRDATGRLLLFQRLGDMLGVLLMTLEYLETGGQKVLQLGIAGVGDQDSLKRVVDCLVIGDLVVGVSLVEDCAAELLQLDYPWKPPTRSPRRRATTAICAFRLKTGAEAAATQAKSNVCAGQRTMLLPTAG